MWPNNGNENMWIFFVCRKMKFRFSDNLNVYKRERECLSRVGENRSCLKLPRNVPPLLLTWLAILLQNQLNFLQKRRKHTLESVSREAYKRKKYVTFSPAFVTDRCEWSIFEYDDDTMMMRWAGFVSIWQKPSDKDCDMLDCHVINIHPTRNCQF